MKKIITKEVVAFWIICLVGGFASGFLSTHGYEKASKPYVPKLEMLSSYKMSCGDEECLRIALQEKTGWGFWEWITVPAKSTPEEIAKAIKDYDIKKQKAECEREAERLKEEELKKKVNGLLK